MAKRRKKEEGKSFQAHIEDFIRILPQYEKYAQVLEKVLAQAAQKYAPLAIVQVRPKCIASFGEKIVRKKYDDPLKQMTDLCGARIITRTQNEVKAVSEFIESHFEIDWDNSVDISQRLKPTEFGYRSIHYIISFKPGVFPAPGIDVKIPQKVFALNAEIQVRTLLEHAWSDIYHDACYKGEFKTPDIIERELAATAALLENADRNFSEIIYKLQAYKSSYGAYLTKDQMEEKIAQLEMILKFDRNNLEIASRIGKLWIALEDWQKAIDVLSRYKETQHAPILKDLGIATCKKHRKTPNSAPYKQGQKYLESACALSAKDVDACASLAGTWKGIDEDRARELYRQAFEMDPSDSYALGNYLECEIAHQQNTDMLPLLKPVIERAIQRCRAQADVGVNLPWAFYDIGKFYLLLKWPYESISAFAKAVQLSTASFMIETSLRSLKKLGIARDSIPGYEWARRLLLLGWLAKFRTEDVFEQVKKLASPNANPIASPVVVFVGGTDAKIENEMQSYRALILDALRNFEGTLISGGTKAGISGLAGDVGERHPKSVNPIGYVPKELPQGVELEDTPNRYREIRVTQGDEFSVLEALQYWTDLLVSGVDPSAVKFIGINGGTIAAAEYRIALAFGARVGIIEGSGREAEQLLKDEYWNASDNLLKLPADLVILQEFLGSSKVEWHKDMYDTIAKAIHEEYRRDRVRTPPGKDPALFEWNQLNENLKESNRQQAQHILYNLTAIGCSVRQVTDRDISRMTFTNEELDQMAEMEHARWVVERLLDGWQWGPERDVNKKVSPYLVSWSKLTAEVKKWDQDTVQKIPEFLANVGFEIVRRTQGK